jgi:diguanylate cyclase (GGDEF)-like protein
MHERRPVAVSWLHADKTTLTGKDLGIRSHSPSEPAGRRAYEPLRSEPDTLPKALDFDQTLSDSDQTASDRDAGSARLDQAASDEDQARADSERARDAQAPGQIDQSYNATRLARRAGTIDRLGSQVARTESSRRRLETATQRDATADGRDNEANQGDVRARAAERSASPSDSLTAKLEQARSRAASDRRKAAMDRERAARDRAEAAAEIARLEAELEVAHLDGLTGAYRREMGTLVLEHEVERARRANGSFVIAFIDIDGMKKVNDRAGHAAGDLVLKTLVWTMRSKLRPFDPIVRYGGDEFVAGLGGASVNEAAERFDEVCDLLWEQVGVGISVGLAELEPDDTLEKLTRRADGQLLKAKARRDP